MDEFAYFHPTDVTTLIHVALLATLWICGVVAIDHWATARHPDPKVSAGGSGMGNMPPLRWWPFAAYGNPLAVRRRGTRSLDTVGMAQRSPQNLSLFHHSSKPRRMIDRAKVSWQKCHKV
jgi:hypothetical protein